MTQREQADGFLAADTAVITAVEALTAEQRDSLQLDLGFLPAPVPFATYVWMRLGEAAAHAWDVRVAFDEGAVIDDATARLLVEQLSGQLALLGFTAKADAVARLMSGRLTAAHTPVAVTVTGSVSLDDLRRVFPGY